MDPLRVTFADCLAEVGEYTALIELVFGHEDHFGVKAGALVENKMLMQRGPAHSQFRLSELAPLGPCPEGGLAIPRAKVAVPCRTSSCTSCTVCFTWAARLRRLCMVGGG